MAIVIDPPRLDPHHRGYEGREKYRFKVDAIEHWPLPGNSLRLRLIDAIPPEAASACKQKLTRVLRFRADRPLPAASDARVEC
jgi:hypothetical protein